MITSSEPGFTVSEGAAGPPPHPLITAALNPSNISNTKPRLIFIKTTSLLYLMTSNVYFPHARSIFSLDPSLSKSETGLTVPLHVIVPAFSSNTGR